MVDKPVDDVTSDGGRCEECGGLGVVIYDGWDISSVGEIVWCPECIEEFVCPRCGSDITEMIYDENGSLIVRPGTRDDWENDDDIDTEEACENCGLIWDQETYAAHVALLRERGREAADVL